MNKKYVDNLKKLNPEKLTRMLRQKQQRYRERKKQEKEAKEAEKITNAMRSGDLNYGMKPDPSFEDFEEFQKEHPEANKSEYLKKKLNHKIEKHHNFDSPLIDVLGNVPYNAKFSDRCEKFRLMHLGKMEFNPFFIDSHNTCMFCMEWYARNKNNFPIRKWTGVNLWNSEEKEPEETISESEQILREEMKREYGDKFKDWIG